MKLAFAPQSQMKCLLSMFVFVILGHFTAVTAFDAQGVDVLIDCRRKAGAHWKAARRLAMPRVAWYRTTEPARTMSNKSRRRRP
jgi:hypothetical protein